MTSHRTFLAFTHLLHKNMLLLGILGAIWLSMHAPVSEAFLNTFDINTPLVALIFVIQGLKMSFEGVGNLRTYGRLIGGAFLVAVVVYPLLAYVLSEIFGLSSDFRIGFMLFSSLPSSLEAAMAMAASAGGDPLTAVILLVALNLIGMASIPANLALWLGGDTPVSELMVLKKLLFYLFLPSITGQILRRLFPDLPKKIDGISHYIPMVCITVLVYVSCSREADAFQSLMVNDLVHIIAPCFLLHVIMLLIARFASTKWLRLDDKPARSFLFITSDKPMSLSVALWSMTYAEHHPLAIFPILVFYVGQVVIDSFIVSRILAKDTVKTPEAKA